MDDYRQKVTDAAVRELRYQMGDDSVDARGTSVQIDGSFRMARVIEAIIRAAIDDKNPKIVEEVARTMAGDHWQSVTSEAGEAIMAVRCRIIDLLDPLP
ncbi:hypothetical protein [Sphingobium yanoikuyae]|uniref:hypothetical protein n=1 Tax=Sphingobium yanoikuyae TaxID=13690 RepID=UPI0022DD2FDA|nr:hypothetical protein [Sphingobium yanoikuyae]WBQ17859.1 hypothetical protein PAE53_06560 [Sphingobium yanoikuyae]